MCKTMIRSSFALVLLALSVPTQQQDAPPSPCPGVFEYEASASMPGRWEGVIHLNPDTPLHSLFLTVVLDSKADLLGNWIGEVSTKDNIEYRIESTDTMVNPGKPLDAKIYVNFNALNKVPLLRKIKLNGKEICNADNVVPATTVTTPTTIQTSLTPKWQTNSVPNLIHPDFETNPVSEHPSRPENPSPVFNSGPGGAVPSRLDGESVPIDNNGQDDSLSTGECGRLVTGRPLIVNGVPAKEREWPWHVALYHLEYVNNNYICGGTLVSHINIITAAHCVTLKDSTQPGQPSTYSVYLGKTNLVTSITGAEYRTIKKIRVHEDYEPSPLLYDIAILDMRHPVQYSSFIQPACLWPESLTSLNSVVGKAGTVVGWGHTGLSATSYDLLAVNMQVVEPLVCVKSHPLFYSSFVSDFTYCAGYKNGSSACNGDSGGGMMFQLGDTWYIRGVVSLAVSQRETQICDTSNYIVFTDVAKFLPWIKSIIRN